ncbi:MAG TPA: hypothetical protein VK619_07845 [Pyrinomonadaceae bacterium]|nr:hypothetical protein [Pyrinomonadaceae bacterium]
MDTLSQTLINYLTASRTEFACVARVNLHARSTSVFSFVVRELYELFPRCVLNALTKTVIANHASNVQILKDNESEQRNERVAQLMSKIAATISDAFMDAPRHFPFLPSLRFSQRFLIRPKESWIGNVFASGKRGEVAESNINSNGSIILWQRYGRAFHREARIPLARCGARDSESLNFTFNRAMQLDSHVSDFRQQQLAVVESKAGLSVGERVVSLARAKAREASLLLCLDAPKESVKRLFYSLENILQDLGMYARNVMANLLDVGQLVGLFDVTHGLSFKPVCVASFLQARIVKLTAKRKDIIQASCLRLARIDAKLKSTSCYIFVSHVCHVQFVSGLVRAGILLIAVFRLACIIAQVEAQI